MMTHFVRRSVALGKKLGWLKVGVVVVLMGTTMAAAIHFLSATPSNATDTTRLPSVTVRSVRDLSLQTTPLVIAGTVRSTAEATVRAEHSGEVTGVYRALGDYVAAGTIVAELDNASERAAVLQAQGSVDAAQANLNKTTGGSRTESRAILEAALVAAKDSAVTTLLSAYAAAESAVPGTTDAMFSNPQSATPYFNIVSSDSQLTRNAEQQRVSLGSILLREAGMRNALSSTIKLGDELSHTEEELRTVRTFLDTIINALNKGVPTQDISSADIADNLAAATTARTSVTNSLTAIASARQALAVAENNLAAGVIGGQPEDVAAAQAALKQAQGSLAAARANLEKTLVRAPISGTINSFSLQRGDYVQATSPVLVVANNGALEVLAYVTENDARELAVGMSAALSEHGTGTVTRIAPAIDPATKKIEVRIGLTSATDTLINGQAVTVEISRTARAGGKPLSKLIIPLSALKISADQTVVFTVSDGILEAHEVTLGALLGDRVEITKGVDADMRIVTDARGLRAGQSVHVLP